MKKGTKKVFFILVIGLILGFVCPVGGWAEEIENIPKPTTAPMNPDFIQYMIDQEEGNLNGLLESNDKRGYIPPPLKRYEVSEGSEIAANGNQPTAYDLRVMDRVTEIRDQNPYGTCWAFASYASLESYMKKEGNSDFSENNLVWNHGFDWGFNDGGNYSITTAYLARWSGPVNESSDPYGSSQKKGLLPNYHVQDVHYISKSPTEIKQALMEGGALYTGMHSEAFDSENYYNRDNAAFYYDGSKGVDHDVAIVGWDDNYDCNNFNNTPPGNGAWIIKNSWGTDWGDDGYFYMSYYDTYAGYEVTAFHNAEPSNNYNRIYQYDPLGNTSSMGYANNDYTAWGANVFTAVASEKIAAVSTYALSPNTTFAISIYTNVNAGQPVSGVLKTTKQVTIPQEGYHTIELDEPVEIINGQKFSVVIKYVTPGNDNPIPIETSIKNYSSAASANTDESFMSFDGVNFWFDLSVENNANVCVKAFTEGDNLASLQSISITTPASKLSYQIGEILDINGIVITGTYSDGTTKIETITAENITGFDSSTADENQMLTVTVNGKTVNYSVTIEEPDNPVQSRFIAFLGKDHQGNYYEYSASDLNKSYLAYQINPALAAAKMYQQFANSQCTVVALKDQAKGYMDYSAAANACLRAQMRGEAFDINVYFAGSDAKVLVETVANVKIVDKDGNVS